MSDPKGEVRPIRTDRLLLRPMESADAAAMLAYSKRADVQQYIPRVWQTLAQAQKWVEGRVADDNAITLIVTLAESGEVVGDVAVWPLDDEHGNAELGYVIHPDHQGRGYATEAVRGALDAAFGDFGVRRITARADVDNAASVKVLERLGFRREAHLIENELFKGKWSSVYDFAILSREWRAPRPD